MRHSAFHQQVAEAVHGGPIPATTALTDWARTNGLTFPCWISATDDPPRTGSSVPRALDLHPGMHYHLVHTVRARDAWIARLAATAVSCGWSLKVVSPGHLIAGFRHAILDLRRRQFPVPAPEIARADPTRLRQSALDLGRAGSAEFRPALERWLDALFHRLHQVALNEIRRELLLFAADQLRDGRRSSEASFRFWAMTELVSQTYSLRHLRQQAGACLLALGSATAHESLLLDGAQSPLVREIANMIAGDGITQLRVTSIAKRLGFSPSYILRRFKAESGMTIAQFVMRSRLQRARSEIIDSDLRLVHVALRCGFPSVENFHRQFKRFYGETPGSFRVHREAPGALRAV